MKKLTEKQEKFVQELIKGKSQREAYRIAYPKSVNWKDSAVDQNASKLLKNTKVLPRYNELNNRIVKEAEDECIVDAKRVLKELAKIAFSNGTDFAEIVNRTVVDRETHLPIVDEYTGEPRTYKEVVVKATNDIPESKRAAISAIKETKYGISVESYDKVKALELIGKHIGMFTDKLEVKGSIKTTNPYDDLSVEELKALARKCEADGIT